MIEKQAPWFHNGTSSLRPSPSDTPASKQFSVCVLGAGLAGCNMAYALASRGIAVRLIDAGEHIASAASGNPVGMVKPFVTREPSEAAAFYSDAYEHLQTLLSLPHFRERSGYMACGALQLVKQLYPDNPAYQQCNEQQAQSVAGTPLNSAALYFKNAGFLSPQALCAALIDHPLISLSLSSAVSDITQTPNGWRLAMLNTTQQASSHQTCTNTGVAETLSCHVLVLANGVSLTASTYTQALPVIAARGQLSRFDLNEPTHPKSTTRPTPRCVISGKHYVIPQTQRLYVGATFERGNSSSAVLPSDNQSNERGLTALLPDVNVNTASVMGFAGVRATTPDRLPLVGPAPNIALYQTHYADLHHGRAQQRYPDAPLFDGLYVLGGFGSRGIVSAPYCASLLSDLIVGRHQLTHKNNNKSSADSAEQTTLAQHKPQPTEQMTRQQQLRYTPLIHPARFCIRQLKKR